MDDLVKYFDHYIISARVKPAFFVVLPLAVTAMAWWKGAQQLGGALLAFLLTFGAVGFLSNLISNHGNKLQARLFAEWGGAPTTALLRHADEHLDIYTKVRYHNCLESLMPGLEMPSRADEQVNPENADLCYSSATNHLREVSRDKSKYPLVYSDNVHYGYARNLLMMRPLGVSASVLGLLINAGLLYPYLSVCFEIRDSCLRQAQSIVGIGSAAVSVLMLWLFVAVVNREYVKARAIRYAKSLLAVCERLST